MSKDQKKTVNINVETVENLIEFFEWLIGIINSWRITDVYPYNLILKISADCYYTLKKLLYQNNQSSKQTKKIKYK